MPRCLMAKKWKSSIAYEEILNSPKKPISTNSTSSINSINSPTFKPATSLTVPQIQITGTYSLVKTTSQNESNNFKWKKSLKRSNKEEIFQSNNNDKDSKDRNIQTTEGVIKSKGAKGGGDEGGWGGKNNPWGPSSPTEGAIAPSPPPSWLPAPTAGKVTVLFNGKLIIF
jgi:hypothetical protein